MIKARKIILKEILKCSKTLQINVLSIRNEKNIRAAMYTDHEISEEEHFSWLENLKSDDRQKVFAVLGENDSPLGVVSVNDIDLKHSKADWAYYLSATERGGLGAALEWMLIEYVFDELKLEKLNCEVIDTNTAVVKMHCKFAFEKEGFRRSNIIKNSERIGVHFLGLTSEDWFAKREDIYAKYTKILSRFDVSFAK